MTNWVGHWTERERQQSEEAQAEFAAEVSAIAEQMPHPVPLTPMDHTLLAIHADQVHERVVAEAQAQKAMRDDQVRALVQRIADGQSQIPQPPQYQPPPAPQRPPYTEDDKEELLTLLVGAHIPGRDGRWIEIGADPLSELRAWHHDYVRYMQDEIDARWRKTDEGRLAVAAEQAIALQHKADRDRDKAKNARRLTMAQDEFAYLVGQGTSPSAAAAHIRAKYGDDA